MRTLIVSSVALAGFIGFSAPIQAAPIAVPDRVVAAAPSIEMVRQRCGAGMKREKAWQDKGGAWHGACVPKR
jgi:hypothetical protein